MSVELLCEFITETDDAVFIGLLDDRRLWVPLSQVEKIKKKPQFDGVYGKIKITNWFANKAGI